MKYFLFILLLISFSGMAQLKAPGKISRNAPTDSTYGLMDDTTITGGMHTYSSIANRDASFRAVRRPGMLASVTFGNKPNYDSIVTYQLQGDSITWIRLFGANISGDFVTITGNQDILGTKTVAQPSDADSSRQIATTAYVQRWNYANFGRFQQKYISYTGTSTPVDTLTYPELIGMYVPKVSRSGWGFKTVTSGPIDSFTVRVNTVTGGVKFGMPINNQEEIVISYQAASAQAAWQGEFHQYVIDDFDSIATMLGSGWQVFYVKTDYYGQGKPAGTPSVYYYYNGTLIYQVSTVVNY